MLLIPEDDERANPLLRNWSQCAVWIDELLNNTEIVASLPPEMKERGWELIRSYDKATGLM
jgi:hypothetical protein